MRMSEFLEISGKSFWRVWVADTVEVNGPGGGVEQRSEDVMMHRKMSLFPILAVHAFSFPWSLLLLRWHYGWRCRGGKGPSWLKPVTFPIFHSPVWVNKDVLLMLPDATALGVPLSSPDVLGVPYSRRLSFRDTFSNHALCTPALWKYGVHRPAAQRTHSQWGREAWDR